MAFDLSRITFDARKDFLGVVMQQGRVQLDADWNEWVSEFARRVQAGTLDVVGRAAVPRETPTGFLVEANGGSLTIGPGRIYVDGILAENHGGPPDIWNRQLAGPTGTTALDYKEQRYLPDPESLPETNGPHLVYLDVWQRDVTHLQDSDLVEKAVGVDSTGRLQTVWQVKLLPNVGSIDCTTLDQNIPGWAEETRPSAGRLSTSTGDLPDEPDPCDVPPAAGYTGRENQLYRAEIHEGGPVGTATFKWSRDNGTVASRVTHINPARDRLTVHSIGRDDVLNFNNGDWVELTDDWRELHNLPGELRRIRLGHGVDPAMRTLELETTLTAGLFPTNAQDETEPARHTRVRRWDQSGQMRREDGSEWHDLDTDGGAIPVPPAGTRLFLEHGILVEFGLDPSDGEFKSGDHWAFAARSVDAKIDILLNAPPLGIHHHYARLAIVTFPDNETDCRTLWPPVSEGESCDCTVCVRAEAHNAGTATIQEAVDAVKAIGGTVCLGAGTYRLRKPVGIDAAQSLRVRGQGWSTVLLGEAPGTVLDIAASSGVALENLTVIGSGTGSGTTAMVRAANVVDLRLSRVNVLGLAARDATSAALEMSGYILGGAITECALVADRGVVSGEGRRDHLLTAQLRADGNMLYCNQRGFSFEGPSLHFGTCAVVGNLILGCAQAAVVVTGGGLPGSSTTIAGNSIHVRGEGIRAGTDGLRIENNEISALDSRAEADAIVLQPGLDPVAIHDVHIIGNRIREVGGRAIAIRHRLGHAVIQQNAVEGVRGAGIAMEGGAAADYLLVADNQFLDLGRSFDDPKLAFAGLQLLAVDRADILDNVFARVAPVAIRAPAVAGILGAGIHELRAAGNRLHGIGPVRGGGAVVGVHLVTPLRHVAVDDNSINRAAEDADEIELARWWGLRIEPGTGSDGAGIVFPTPSRFAYVTAGRQAFLLTAHHVVARPMGLSVASLRGNRLLGVSTAAPVVHVEGVESCLFADNHCQSVGAGESGALLCNLNARVVNASNNRLIGKGDLDTLSISNTSKRGVVIGNVSTGNILVDGASLPAPWDQLNLIGT